MYNKNLNLKVIKELTFFVKSCLNPIFPILASYMFLSFNCNWSESYENKFDKTVNNCPNEILLLRTQSMLVKLYFMHEIFYKWILNRYISLYYKC